MILERIFEQARTMPQRLAMTYRGNRISYGEFAYWISLARDFLASQNLHPGGVAILVRVPNIFDSWVLRFALRNLGLTTVDLTDPDQLGAYDFKNVRCVVTTIHDQPIQVPNEEYKLVQIPDPLFFGKRAGAVPAKPRADVPVGGHIVLTSGTSGVRKKVLRDDTREAADLERGCEIFGISKDSLIHALNFGPWSAAGYGLPVVAWSVGSSVLYHEGKDLHRSFDNESITHAFFIPTKLEEVLAAPPGELRFNPKLRIFVGGAALTPALAAEAKARFTPHVYHTLGSTEGGALGLTRIERPDDLASHVIVPGAGLQIVDEADNPLPPGSVGVIRVRPVEGLTGYLDDEEASRRFFRDGYFYPGDLGEMLPDGRLVLHGRTTSTINLGGEKRAVEILEQQLQDRLRVDAVCLVSVRSPSQEDELHILIQSCQSIGRDEVVRALARVADLANLPRAHVQHVDSIPRNEMGKIDRPRIRQNISAMLAKGPGVTRRWPIVVEKICDRAEREPNKIAICFGDRRISYGEFACWISLAREFFSVQGLRPGSVAALVGLPNLLVGWPLRLALQSLGLITVDAPDAQVLFGLDIRNVGWVITPTHDETIELPDAKCKLLRIPDSLLYADLARRAANLPPGNAARPGGHILLTSGTTGYKKKVLRDAAFDASYLKYGCERYKITADSVVHNLDFAPWTAAGYGFPQFAWSAGASVVFPAENNLHRCFQLGGLTHAFVSPAQLEEILAAPESELRYNPNLRLLVSGAPLSWRLAAAARSRLTPNVIHMLSSTEGGTLAMTVIQGPEDLTAHALLPGVEVQIVDSADRPLAIGQAGAIRIRPHEGLTGYLDDEPATREFFRDGYFYPGDLGEIRPDGQLVLHGRTSNVINLGGEKRPVEAIEQQMQDRLGAEAICLLSVAGHLTQDELHILIESRRAVGKAEILDALVRVAALSRAPSAHIRYVDKIPRNEMGKIDRPAIRQRISAMPVEQPAA